MASLPPTIDTIPYHAGIGKMRRFASAFFERAHSVATPGPGLRGALPIRYPGDAAGLDHDPLTGLASQPVFAAALGRWVTRATDEGSTFSLVLFDIDTFGGQS